MEEGTEANVDISQLNNLVKQQAEQIEAIKSELNSMKKLKGLADILSEDCANAMDEISKRVVMGNAYNTSIN